MNDKNNISLLDKYCLTIEEAATIFGIGQNHLREFIKHHENEQFILHKFILHIGRNIKIKQDLFKKYLDEKVTVI